MKRFEFLLDKRFWLVVTGISGIVIASYFGSLLLYAQIHLSPELARPWSAWYFLFEPLFQKKALVSLAIPHGLLVAVVIAFIKNWKKHNANARWATLWDLRKAKLLEKEGLLLGKFKGQYLINNAPTHVIALAPTRSGKGVGLVIPNLLNWQGSVICLDIKQENYRLTSGFRKEYGHEVYQWAPVSPDKRSHRYNPLDAISRDPHKKISDIQSLAKILIPDPTHGDDFWASEARSLFTGLVLYVLDAPEMPSTIGSVYRILGAEGDLGDICRHIVDKYPDLPIGGKKTLISFANKADKERSGVKSSLDKALHLWTEPMIDAVTSASDFSLADLRKKRMAVYVGVPTNEVGRIAPLLRLFFEQAITTLSRQEPGRDEPHKVLLLIDEMHMMGDMSTMTTAFTLLAGYNCRVMAIVQGLGWLDVVYGKEKRNAILSGCAHQIFFAPNDLDTPAYISQSCGERTVESVSISKKSSFKHEGTSKNISHTQKPLISKGEIRLIKKDEEIMIVEGSRPVRAKKIVYYKDKQLQVRLLKAPAVPELKIEEQKIPKFNVARRSKSASTEDIPDSSDYMPHPPHSSPSLDGLLDLFPEEPKEPAAAEGFVNSILKALRDEE